MPFKIIREDITKIKCKDIPKHDILCAGFPCQPFSISGNKKGFKDENGKLFFEIVRIARFHKPKVIFLENVKNLEVHDGGQTLDTIKKKLKELGYKTFAKVLNSSDFEVPQARKRIYIVALKNNLKITDFKFPEGYGELKCLEEILLSDISEEYWLRHEYEINHDINEIKTNRLLRIGSIGPGRQGERIYSIKGQSITLSSQGGGPGGKTGIYYMNNGIRILCPRECARLMGYPDDFMLAETKCDAYKQFGNSVVVNVIQEIAKEISIKLEEVTSEKH